MKIEEYCPTKDVEDYVNGVVSGQTVACEAIVAACRRHNDDLQRQRTDDFPYYYDAEHAAAVCLFFPTMVKHSIGKDEGKPFFLQPWQAFAVSSIFGWKLVKNDLRRFSKAYISLARKNGKSSLASAICLFCAGFDWNPVSKTFEGVSQIVLAASKKEQADRVTMAECIRMRSRSETISGMSIHQNKQITFGHNNGHIITVGSDKAFDGLNPHVVQIDEMHAFRSTGNQAEFISTMKTGSGARVQPIYLVTTTAGSTASVLWKSEWEYATGVARGDISDDSYFALSYELDEGDDPLDEDNWPKANPCLGVTLTIDYLRDQAKPAAADKVGLNRFTRYHGNRLVSNLDSAFDVEQWDDCAGELSDWREADAICCGIDLGGRDDLASLSLVARFDTGETSEDEDALPIYRYEVRCWNYLATDTVRDIAAEPFASFIDKGLIRTTKFPVSELERDTVRECLEYGAHEVAIDPYQAQATGERLETEGLLVASMTQSCRHFNEPITELRQAISDGRFRHDGNPVLRWMVSNAVLISDRNDRVMFSKKDSAEKIDGVVSMTMAFGRAMLSPSKAKGYFTT